ncbi:sugar phosphate isomerase/epimerase family protein [Massilia orientalis]|uniref:Sugar phosphate isomerase/epimerase family protein n=1 Tax=Massilia orientalis TaxID=3050128 RepID=A0ACC7MKF1_9BURK|nr:sugar phosphate isomerase/epimerase [Massilia sp. YIM B02787]
MKTKRAMLPLILVLLGASAHGAAPQTAPRLAVQLWSVKDEIRRDFDGMLAQISRLGFQGVEFAGQFGPYRQDPAALKALLDKNGLQCAGAHVMLAQLAPHRLEATTAFYRLLGCTNLVVPMDPRGATPGESAGLARDLAALSATLAANGMRIGYHNHAQEMAGTVGGTPWDVIAQGTPQETILQQDVGWTVFAGKDPISYVRRYPGRTLTIHFKAKPAAGSSSKPIIGQDGADWAGLVRAVREAGGTEWIIVEQEEYPDGMGQLESVAASLAGLRALMVNAAAK